MARIASDKKMSYYPTDSNTITEVIRILDLNNKERQGTTIIDPCCGEGDVLVQFQNEAKAKVYGVELNHDRNKKAFAKIGPNILSGNALYDIERTIFGAGLLFLNPPYATKVGNSTSMETSFVKEWQYDVTNGGFMVLVINDTTLRVMEQHLQKYQLIGCYHDDKSDDYKKYGQKVFILRKKTFLNKSELNLIESYKNSVEISSVKPIEFTKFKKGRKIIPTWKEFKTPAWKLSLITFEKKDDLRKKFSIRVNGYGGALIDKNSVTQVSPTHSAFLIATGLISEKELVLENGKRIILKGTIEKYDKVSDKLDDNGKLVGKITSEDFKTNIIGLNLDERHFEYYSA